MKFNYTLPSIFIGLLLALIQPPAAKAISCNEQVDSIGEKITVLIASQVPGSGVIIQREGNTYTVLTAYHVVNQPHVKYEIVTPDNQRHQVKYSTVKTLSENVDLAVLRFTSSQNYQVAKIGNSDEAKRRTNIYITGFPKKTGGVPVPFYDCRDGQILANATQISVDGGYTLFYDNATLPGMSGGPVLNEKGEVIGIHGRSEPAVDVNFDAINPAVATVTSGRNAGIPINTFVRMSAKASLNVGVNVPAIKVTTSQADDLFAGEQLIKQKLDSIPVYLVTNDKGYPLTRSLAKSQNVQQNANSATDVYLSRQDAQKFLNDLRNTQANNPKIREIVKHLQVRAVPLGVVYQQLEKSKNQPKGLLFVFKPVDREIATAMQLLRQTSQNIDEFKSVPIFMVKAAPDMGYATIKLNSKKEQIIPLFFSKQDAEVLLNQIKENYPKADIKVTDLDRVIKLFRDNNYSWLNQVVLVPSPESRAYIKTLPRDRGYNITVQPENFYQP